MIDAQSIVVATVACYDSHEEGMNAVGTILRAVIWHSLALLIQGFKGTLNGEYPF